MGDHDDDHLCEFLSKSGLANTKWLKRFNDENITKVDRIHELEFKDVFLSLSSDATQEEITALRKIFNMHTCLHFRQSLIYHMPIYTCTCRF